QRLVACKSDRLNTAAVIPPVEVVFRGRRSESESLYKDWQTLMFSRKPSEQQNFVTSPEAVGARCAALLGPEPGRTWP
ncbi:hypothetical protein GBF38_009452, partial [Nibea albiflora]